jgi:hypothetical protein
MFARFLEMTVKPEKRPELIKKTKDEILPILKKHTSFVDLIPLELETDPTKLYSISLWRDKRDAEKFEREDFPRVKAILEPFMTMPIAVKLCTVEETIFTGKPVAAAA